MQRIINDSQSNPTISQQPLISIQQDREQRKKKCCTTTFLIISLVLGLLLMTIAIIGPDFLTKKMNEGIDENIKMTAQNQQRWSSLPGENNVFMVRDFTFYELQDPFAYFFYPQQQDSQLVVKEVGPFSYQECSNMTELEFNSNKTVVNFNKRQFFIPVNGTTGNETVNVLNFAPLGLIYSAKNSNMSTLSLNSLAEMVMGIASGILQSVLRNGVDYQVFGNSKDRTKGELAMKQAGLSKLQREAIWNDKIMGWNNTFSRMPWVVAGLESVDGGGSQVLKDYFKLTDGEFSPLYEFFLQGIQMVNSSTLRNHYCNETAFACDKKFFVSKQWSSQGISMNPPPGTQDPTNSSADANLTLFGFPELGFFSKYGIDLGEEYKNVYYPIEWAMDFLYWNDNASDFAKNSSNIFNIGNMDFFWQNGMQFDQNQSDSTPLQAIAQRFQLNTTQQTRVLWEFLKYQVNEIGFNLTFGGSRAISIMSKYTAPLIAQGFLNTYDYLLPTVYQHLFYVNITKSSLDCVGFFSYIEDISKEQLNIICTMNEFQSWNIDSMDWLDDLCWVQSDAFFQSFKQQTGLTNSQLLSFCNSKNGRLGNMLDRYGKQLSSLYNCTKLGQYCSQQEITAKQWASSLITRNPPEEIRTYLSPANTAQEWNNSITPSPWEYYYFTSIHKYYNNTAQTFSDADLKTLLDWNRIFSQTMVGGAIRNYKSKRFGELQNLMFFDEQKAQQLVDYFRYIFLYSKLGGITLSMTVNEVLFGRVDPFIKELSEQDPQRGGDPSIDPKVRLNDNNDTETDRFNYKQAFFTGTDDVKRTRFYQSINGQPFITEQKRWFDGLKVHEEYLSPWKENIAIDGTDSSQNNPHMTMESEMKVLVTSLSRQGGGQPTGVKKDIYGMETWQFMIGDDIYNSSKTYKNNSIFYQDEYDGLINMTSVKRVPIFISQRRMLRASESVAKRVVYFNSSGAQVLADQKDQTVLYLQPNTGVPFAVALNAQANLLLQPDEIFNVGSDLIIPIFNTFRSMNLSEATVDANYSQLKTVIQLKRIIPIIGYSVGGFFLLVSLVLAFYRYQLSKEKLKESEIGQELFPEDENQGDREIIKEKEKENYTDYHA